MQTLQPNSLLQGGRYKILSTLGQGGFGITYLAIQSGLERKVAVKEFFMRELCERDESTSHVTLGTEGSRETVSRFREKFLKEARNIAKLNHPNIVRIIDVFEENGTAYYVMEYAENGSLADRVKREMYLSEPVATRYILQVASALEYIHQQKMNHLDVKPANIMLNEKDEAVLIDFGLSKQYDATTGNQTSTTPVGISEGYAPMEQYKQGGVGEFSPETDIYSLGATFFKLLTGVTPPSASDVNEDGLPVNELKEKGVSQTAIDTIIKAMEGRKRDRQGSVQVFVESLMNKNESAVDTDINESTQIISPITPSNLGTESEQNDVHLPSKKLKYTPFLIGLLIALVVIVVAVVAFSSGNSKPVPLLEDVEANVDTDMVEPVVDYECSYSETEEPASAEQIDFKGYINNKYAITMSITVSASGEITGSYYYDKQGSAHTLSIEGSQDGSTMILNEYNSEGMQSGYFEGSFDGYTYDGEFTNYRGDTMYFNLTKQ